MWLSAASNLEIPAFLALTSKGYEVQRETRGEWELWTAIRGEDRFHAESPLLLLGVVSVAEERGENWPATDEQIDSFWKRFGDETD